MEAVQNAALSTDQKTYFTARYMDLVNRYRCKYNRINKFYNTLRITVMVGSIFIPALLTLQKDPTTVISETTYWIVFALSLCVTLSNSLLELFNVAAINTKYWLHVHRLETEGWQFLHLSENYARFESLQDAFPKFTSKVEKLHLSLVFDLLRLENRNKSSNSDSKTGESVGGGGFSNNGGSLSSKNVFLPSPTRTRLEGLDNESTDLDQKRSRNKDTRGDSLDDQGDRMLMSLQEFQNQLGEDAKKE